MRYQVISYLKFLKASTNEHGVHSPFIYDLLTKCLYKKNSELDFKKLATHRKWFFDNKTVIDVEDFGAGSRVFKSNERKVSKIAKHVGMSFKRQRLLSKLTSYLAPSEILEIGTSLGLATMAMHIGKPFARVITVEGCANTSAVARDGFDKFNATNIDTVINEFEQFFKSENFRSIKKIDLAFIDGNHSKDATLTYFKHLLSKVHNDTVLIFDDIYWSPAMTAAWRTICDHPEVTVSIDTFKWGLVFFRKEQRKEHFILRM